jgi:uncharacterized protein (TIGR02147 family)
MIENYGPPRTHIRSVKNNVSVRAPGEGHTGPTRAVNQLVTKFYHRFGDVFDSMRSFELKLNQITPDGASMTAATRQEILSYDCYRALLRDWFVAEKARTRSVTLGYVGKHMGVSRMFVKYVLDGKKHLNAQHIPAVASMLKLKAQETQYFKALHRFNRSKVELERTEALKDLLRARGLLLQPHNIGCSDEDLFSHWTVSAILQMRDFPGFKHCPNWIQSRLKFKVSKAEIVESLRKVAKFEERLAMLGEPTKRPIKLPDGFVSAVYKQYAKDVIALAGSAVEMQAREDRQIFNFTVALPENRFEEAKKMIEELRHQLHATLGNSEVCERVIQINCQLFTLAKHHEGE